MGVAVVGGGSSWGCGSSSSSSSGESDEELFKTGSMDSFIWLLAPLGSRSVAQEKCKSALWVEPRFEWIFWIKGGVVICCHGDLNKFPW